MPAPAPTVARDALPHGRAGLAFLHHRQLLAEPVPFVVEVDEFPPEGFEFTAVPGGPGIGKIVQAANRSFEMVGFQRLNRHALFVETPQVERHQRLPAAYRRPFPNVQRRHLAAMNAATSAMPPAGSR